MRTRKRTCFALWHGVERQLTQTEQSESTDPTQTERTRPTSRTSSSDRESERICDQEPFPGIDHKLTTRSNLPDRSKSHSSQARSLLTCERCRPRAHDCLPTSRLTNFEKISRRPVRRVGVCRNSIDEEINPILKGELPKDLNELTQILL